MPEFDRTRRIRKDELGRELVAENRVHPSDLVMPHFVLPGGDESEDVPSMPGIQRHSVDRLVEEVRRDLELGLKWHILFCIPDHKDELGTGAWQGETTLTRATEALRDEFGDEVYLIADVCLCQYTDHGHCGVLDDDRNIDNDRTIELLARTSISAAQAGIDLVAPSDMMDGRIAHIRSRLDEEGFEETPIMSYASKFASAYYGPFRHAADSSPDFGNREGYQMDVRNGREAVREALIDEEEGADIVMVKPALANLDVVARLRERTELPLAVYEVSGEYAQIKAAAEEGWLVEEEVVLENWHAMRRAGADIILTYHARKALEEGWIA